MRPVWAVAAALPVFLLGAAIRPAAAQGCGTGYPPGPFKVALDVGHSVSQPGATSARGVTEFQCNRRLAESVAAALARLGIAHLVVGAAGTPMPLVARPRLAQAAGATLFLSLHHDSVQPRYLQTWMVDGQPRQYSDRFHGFSVFVSAENARAEESVRFATGLGNGLRAAGFTPSLHHAEPIPGEGRPLLDARIGLYRFDGLAVLRTASMPAALLEAAVIVNRAEEEQVGTAAFLDTMAASVAAAIQRYCAARPQSP